MVEIRLQMHGFISGFFPVYPLHQCCILLFLLLTDSPASLATWPDFKEGQLRWPATRGEYRSTCIRIYQLWPQFLWLSTNQWPYPGSALGGYLSVPWGSGSVCMHIALIQCITPLHAAVSPCRLIILLAYSIFYKHFKDLCIMKYSSLHN